MKIPAMVLIVMSTLLPLGVRGQTAVPVKTEGLTGTLLRYTNFPSEFVDPRNVDVWLPDNYDVRKKYAVVYMHDGQNLFIPELSYTKIDWGVDETVTRLALKGEIPDVIVVGIWNTPKRVPEYMPQKALRYATNEKRASAPEGMLDAIASDNYLKFIVTELKPFIDRNYETAKDRRSTFIMGSSMGGLISLYAISEYPDIFGGAGCMSTHFPAGDGITIKYFADNLPDPKTHIIYFDYGTETLDAQYEPYQLKMDEAMKAGGYEANRNWTTLKFEGADHSELAWRARLEVPLKFLLKK